MTLLIRKPGPENIYLAYRRKLFSDPGSFITKSATSDGYGYCDCADFSESTFRMTAVVDNNAGNGSGNNLCDNPDYNTGDPVHDYRDVLRSDHSIQSRHGVRHYHNVRHLPRRRCPANRGSWP